jgi:transposase-like protein
MSRASRSIRPSQCACCSHPERARLELARVGGASLDAVAAQFGVSRDSVHRHFKAHVTDKRRAELMAGPAQVEKLAVAAAKESKSLLEQLTIVRSVLFRQFLNAAEAGDRPGVANVAGRLLESLRELGKLTGELRQLSGVTVHNTLNLVTSPQFLALQDGLLRVARAHPEAKADIVAVLRGLDEPPLSAVNGSHAPVLIEGASHVVA